MLLHTFFVLLQQNEILAVEIFPTTIMKLIIKLFIVFENDMYELDSKGTVNTGVQIDACLIWNDL